MSQLTNLWPQVSAIITQAERPSRYINHEWGSTSKPEASFHFCLVYPDTYELGQPNQALRILTNVVNAHEEMEAQRGFLPAPDMCDLLREHNIPLFSLEGCAPLAEFDVLGFTLPHELAATNVLEALDLARIPLHPEDRSEEDPIVVAGGPCACNPEPYAIFFDAFNIGEGEEMLPDGLEVVRTMKEQGAKRHDILMALAKLPGWYVPSFYTWLDESTAQERGTWLEPKYEGLPSTIERQIYKGFHTSDAWEPCVVPFNEVVHDRLDIEILRGCARGCRFCQAGMMYRPVRERTADNVVQAVRRGIEETGYNEVSLTSLSSTDHSQIAEILTRLNAEFDGKAVKISIPSQRLDAFGTQMADLVAGPKKGSLTFAPEAGTQRLRDVINKNVTEENLFAAIDAAFKAGWTKCKLYFMCGLPTETDDDIIGMADLVSRAFEHARAALPENRRGMAQIGISVAVFVPKAQTPFQWEGQIDPEEVQRRINLLRRSVKYRAIRVSWHDPQSSFVEAVMSRGGREVSSLVEEAWKRGARFDAWSECFNEDAWRDAAKSLGIDMEEVAQKTQDTSYVMPWEHVSVGLERDWLVREHNRAYGETPTPDCTFEKCSICGTCMKHGFFYKLAEKRALPQDNSGNTSDTIECEAK